MTDHVGRVIDATRRAEEQLQMDTIELSNQICARDAELRRSRALMKLFEEKRFAEDIKSRRLFQPPIFFEAWNNVIGKMNQYVKGADEGALAQMFASFENTLRARADAHASDLKAALE